MRKGSKAAGCFVRGFFIGSLVCFGLSAAGGLSAQEEAGAVIYHAEGAGFSVTLNDKRNEFSAEAAAGGEIKLEKTGMVNTGPGSSVEIQLPSGAVVKLAENTSLIYNGNDNTGKNADLGLLYGRIRAASGAGENLPGVIIRSGGVSTLIKEGDLGVDFFLNPESFTLRPLFRLYTFRGKAEVSPHEKGAGAAYFGGFTAITAEEGWRLTIDIASPFTFAEKAPLDEEIKNYWRSNNFAGSPPRGGKPDTAIAEAPAPRPVENPQAAYIPEPAYAAPPLTPAPAALPGKEPVVVGNTGKHACLVLGLLLTLGSVTVQALAKNNVGPFTGFAADSAFNGAYATLGLGLMATLVGTLYNPKLEYR